ncbi:MAG: methyltransferase family protein [Promethearchaeota archaeon]
MTEQNKNIGGEVDDEKKVDKMDQPFPNLLLLIIPVFAGVFIALCVFPLAGDWIWVEGWIFVIIFMVFSFLTMQSLNRKNPRVMRNRMKYRKEKKMEEKKSEEASESDKFILPIFGITFILMFVISDLDHRLDWSKAFPFWLEVIGFAIMGIGFYIIHLSTLQNAYASKVLDIREGQQLIDTGLYAHIRHPLYSGALGMIVGIPLGLGSWWAILPAVISILGLIYRIKFEEEMLITGLEGYNEYRERVKYKLIPKIY